MTEAATIRARAQGQSVGIRANRPSWADMKKHYPAESVKSADFYPMVSKAYQKAFQTSPETWSNTCATRMSYALNRSGLKLPVAPNGGSIVGDDKYNYWIRVAQLSKKLSDHLGKPDFLLKHEPIERFRKDLADKRVEVTRKFLSTVAGKKGIVVFEVTGWQDATGHFTLWDGKDLLYVGEGSHNDQSSYEYYFWFLRTMITDKVMAQTTKVSLWELK